MKKDDSERLSELEHKIREVTSLIFALCEERIRASRAKPSPLPFALAASALAVEKAVAAFLAVARISE